MALSDLRLFDPELWKKYKEGLPASITDGETDALSAILAEKDSKGDRIFQKGIDTLASLAGEPAPSLGGAQPRRRLGHRLLHAAQGRR